MLYCLSVINLWFPHFRYFSYWFDGYHCYYIDFDYFDYLIDFVELNDFYYNYYFIYIFWKFQILTISLNQMTLRTKLALWNSLKMHQIVALTVHYSLAHDQKISRCE